MLIGGDKKMLVFNDLEPSEKIKIYDTRFDYKTDEEKNRLLVDYRTGDVFIPKVELREALSGLAADFIKYINENKAPTSTAQSGLEVLRILEASQQSIKSFGKEILL